MRHFTPEEANAALEQLRPLVEQLVATRREHALALERQEELERKIREFNQLQKFICITRNSVSGPK